VWPKGPPESASDQQDGVLLSGESLALIPFLALVDLECAFSEEVEVAVRFPAVIYRLPSFVAPLGDPYLRFLQTPQHERYWCIPK